MSKKNDKGEREKPDYESFKTVQAIDEEIAKTKTEICRKTKQLFQTKEAKKEAVAAFNEQIKECTEEVDHNLGVLDELNTRRRVVEKGATTLRSVPPSPAGQP